MSAWQQQLPDKDGLKSTVYDIAYSPDGAYLAAACGSRVFVFNAGTGEQLHALKGHKDQVHCVSWSKDGAFFASGGADKSVIIWQSSGEGLLKFSHSDSLQASVFGCFEFALGLKPRRRLRTTPCSKCWLRLRPPTLAFGARK